MTTNLNESQKRIAAILESPRRSHYSTSDIRVQLSSTDFGEKVEDLSHLLQEAREEGAAAERRRIEKLINSTANDFEKLDKVVRYLNTPSTEEGNHLTK